MYPNANFLNPAVHLVLLYNDSKGNPIEAAKIGFAGTAISKALNFAGLKSLGESFLNNAQRAAASRAQTVSSQNDAIDILSSQNNDLAVSKAFLKNININFNESIIGEITIELVDTSCSYLEYMFNLVAQLGTFTPSGSNIAFSFLNFKLQYGWTVAFDDKSIVKIVDRDNIIHNRFTMSNGSELLSIEQNVVITNVNYKVESFGIVYTLKGYVPCNSKEAAALISNLIAGEKQGSSAQDNEKWGELMNIAKGDKLWIHLKGVAALFGKKLGFSKEVFADCTSIVAQEPYTVVGRTCTQIMNEIVSLMNKLGKKHLVWTVFDESDDSATNIITDKEQKQLLDEANFIKNGNKLSEATTTPVTRNNSLLGKILSLNQATGEAIGSIINYPVDKYYEVQNAKNNTETAKQIYESNPNSFSARKNIIENAYQEQTSKITVDASDQESRKAALQQQTKLDNERNKALAEINKQEANITGMSTADKKLLDGIDTQNLDGMFYVQSAPDNKDVKAISKSKSGQGDATFLGTYRFFADPNINHSRNYQTGCVVISVDANIDKWLESTSQNTSINIVTPTAKIKTGMQETRVLTDGLAVLQGAFFDQMQQDSTIRFNISNINIKDAKLNLLADQMTFENAFGNKQTFKGVVNEFIRGLGNAKIANDSKLAVVNFLVKTSLLVKNKLIGDDYDGKTTAEGAKIPNLESVVARTERQSYINNMKKNAMMQSLHITVLGDLELHPSHIMTALMAFEFYDINGIYNPTISGIYRLMGYDHEIGSCKFITRLKLFNAFYGQEIAALSKAI